MYLEVSAENSLSLIVTGRSRPTDVRIDTIAVMDSPRWTVWDVLTDTSYIPKLYADIVTVEANPPGRAVPGQRCRILGRVGTFQVAIFIEFTRVDTEVCLASRGIPGGLFKSFEQTVVLEAIGLRTEVGVRFEYEFSPELTVKLPDVAFLERLVEENFKGYIRNLKEICELLPLPR